MMLCGEGFMIASGKTDEGEWNWRTFGTGEGFTADAIIAGYLSADRIEANSIGTGKLSKDVNDRLQEVSGLKEWVSEAEIKIQPDSIVSTVMTSKAYQDSVSDLQKSVTDAMDDLTIGGRNLIRTSRTMIYRDYLFMGLELLDEKGDALLDEAGKYLVTAE